MISRDSIRRWYRRPRYYGRSHVLSRMWFGILIGSVAGALYPRTWMIVGAITLAVLFAILASGFRVAWKKLIRPKLTDALSRGDGGD